MLMTLHHRHIFYGLLVSVLMGLASCSADDIFSGFDDADPIALRGVQASIVDGTESRSLTDDERQFRALVDEARMSRAVAPLVDQIGKYNFLRTDEIVFTTIERTKRPIPDFSYNNVIYSCEIAGENNVSWKRLDPLQDIYWSDGASPHTFKGYILPHPEGEKASDANFDWNHDGGRGYYYGSIGNPTETPNVSADHPNGYIDYQGSAEPGADVSKPYSTELLSQEDLLLTYDTDMQNEDAMAWVHFHHGLASVRVTVTITGYSTTGEDPDSETRVSNMFLHDQPTMYKWNNEGYTTEPLVAEDQSVLNTFGWGAAAPAWDQKRDMRLWQPRIYHGSGVGRTFTFYGITAPGKQDEVNMTFHVSYPDPLDPRHTARLEREYTSTLKLDRPIEFRPGYCTSININLNHKNEKMTVGAEYMSWQYIDQPDEGTLRKNSTFLSYTDRSKVTIAGDKKATIDDATWLYQTNETDAEGKPVIKDIYGNDGSAQHPYLICTADQLLSFAYEVKGGRDFVHQFIKLDSDITLQPSKKEEDEKAVSWIGIGDATNPFNGFFLGSGRYINNLYGEHFFHTVGDNAVIDKLNFSNVVEVQGCGVVAHKNLGLICGCHIEGDVSETSNSARYTGSIVGENHSFIIACAHVGKVSGYGIVGGLVGFNNGTVMACYHAGEIVGLGGTTDIHATVGKRGDGTGGTNNSIMFSCYYDTNLISHTPTLVPSKSGFPFSTGMMQSDLFVNGGKEFQFDSYTGAYTGQSQKLQEVLLFLMYGDEQMDAHASETAEQLMNSLVSTGGLTGRVNDVFGYHFSLNEALRAFRLWLNAIAAQNKDEVETNCHKFTKLQIDFLRQHYTAEHKFIYAPATYPKVQ